MLLEYFFESDLFVLVFLSWRGHVIYLNIVGDVYVRRKGAKKLLVLIREALSPSEDLGDRSVTWLGIC